MRLKCHKGVEGFELDLLLFCFFFLLCCLSLYDGWISYVVLLWMMIGVVGLL
jgi:hypothetical protein